MQGTGRSAARRNASVDRSGAPCPARAAAGRAAPPGAAGAHRDAVQPIPGGGRSDGGGARMIEEVHLLGVYMPAALLWAVLAAVLVYLLRVPIQRLPGYSLLWRLLWHPSLLELALFVLLWWGLSAFA